MPRRASEATRTSYAGVRKLTLPNGRVVFQAKWYGPDGRQYSKQFDRARDADRYRCSQLQAVERGEFIDPRHTKTTVEESSAVWMASLGVSATTRASYESVLSCHVLPAWGTTKLPQLTRTGIATWLHGLSRVNGQPLSSATRRKVAFVLSSTLDAAVSDGRLARNPMRAVHGSRRQSLTEPVHTNKPRRFLTHHQVRALTEAMEPHYRPLVQVLAYTGLRVGEVFALRGRDYDALRGRLLVARTASEPHGKLTYGPTKTHQSRTVSVPSHVRPALETLQSDRGPDDLLFTTASGAPMRHRSLVRRVWPDAVKAAGLAPLTPHDLRHTAASLAISAGANVKAVQGMLGHASATMTLDTYADLFPDDLDAVADSLAEAAARAAEPSNVTAIRSR